MRIATPGIERVGGPFGLRFEGRAIAAWPGESIAAALIANDIADFRIATEGDRRGVYCGMGVCGECRVIVDGRVLRACMTAAEPGQDIRRATAEAEPGVAPQAAARPAIAPDLLIVGAGPAGLSAACVAARAGLTVVVADERAQAGGQYYKQPGHGFAVEPGRIDAQFAEGRQLVAAAVDAGAEIMPGATLWAASVSPEGALEVHFLLDGAAMVARPRRLILAMGAYEKPWPVPGWTLPGVMTSGAAQTLLRAYQVAPGRRVLVAGNGPLNLQVARELQRAGVEVVALAEQAPAPGVAQLGAALRMARASSRLFGIGVAQLAALRLAGGRIHYGHVLTGAVGKNCVERASIARISSSGLVVPGSEQSFDVDAVCLGYGFAPQTEAARALGCAFVTGPGGEVVAIRDQDGRSSLPNVFIAGDGGGLGGARVALAQGELAGLAASEDLGGLLDRAGRAAARRRLASDQAFQRALWSLFAPAGPFQSTDPNTLLCRCERVSAGRIDALIAGGETSLGGLKRAGRVGMGACQGRYCTAVLARRLPGQASDESAAFAPRSPFKPVPIASIVALSEHGRTANESSLKEH